MTCARILTLLPHLLCFALGLGSVWAGDIAPNIKPVTINGKTYVNQGPPVSAPTECTLTASPTKPKLGETVTFIAACRAIFRPDVGPWADGRVADGYEWWEAGSGELPTKRLQRGANPTITLSAEALGPLCLKMTAWIDDRGHSRYHQICADVVLPVPSCSLSLSPPSVPSGDGSTITLNANCSNGPTLWSWSGPSTGGASGASIYANPSGPSWASGQTWCVSASNNGGEYSPPACATLGIGAALCNPTSITRTSACPVGQNGSITERQDTTCPGFVVGDWVEVNNTCSDTCTPGPQTRTVACPVGQSGSITEQQDTTCPGSVSSGWYQVANTCATTCVLQPDDSRLYQCPGSPNRTQQYRNFNPSTCAFGPWLPECKPFQTCTPPKVYLLGDCVCPAGMVESGETCVALPPPCSAPNIVVNNVCLAPEPISSDIVVGGCTTQELTSEGGCYSMSSFDASSGKMTVSFDDPGVGAGQPAKHCSYVYQYSRQTFGLGDYWVNPKVASGGCMNTGIRGMRVPYYQLYQIYAPSSCPISGGCIAFQP